VLEVTVPCQGCGAALGFAERRCRQCGARPTREVSDALHARLSAASADYRDLQDQISAARTVLLLLALTHLALVVLAYAHVERSPFPAPELEASMRLLLLTDLALGALFAVLWWLGRRFPAVSMFAGTGAWLLLQTTLFVFSSPLSLFAGAWLKGVVLILLLRGLVAGVKAHRCLAKLHAPATGSLI
jgi:hypothetical protein